MERPEEGKVTKNQKKRWEDEPRKLRILVPIDGSEMTDLVVKRSGQFTRWADAELTLLVVIEDVVSLKEIPSTPIYEEKKKVADKILRKAKKDLNDHGVECKTRIAAGPVAQEIVRIAEEEGFHGIFMGSRGLRGLKRMLLGSVADDVVRYAHCPVLIIR